MQFQGWNKGCTYPWTRLRHTSTGTPVTSPYIPTYEMTIKPGAVTVNRYFCGGRISPVGFPPSTAYNGWAFEIALVLVVKACHKAWCHGHTYIFPVWALTRLWFSAWHCRLSCRPVVYLTMDEYLVSFDCCPISQPGLKQMRYKSPPHAGFFFVQSKYHFIFCKAS